MSVGYEVCIHRDGRWEVYSFFDNHQEQDAIYQARDIANNYSAVCVLWPTEMRIVYFKSNDASKKSPKYMDVRADLKLAKKQTKSGPIQKKPINTSSLQKDIENAKPKEEKEEEEDPHFTKADKAKAVQNTVITSVIGIIFAFLTPTLLSAGASAAVKNTIMLITLMISAFVAYLVYQMTEQICRTKNRSDDIDCDDPWMSLGLSEETLEKLAEEQSPEIANAISMALPELAPLDSKSNDNEENSNAENTDSKSDINQQSKDDLSSKNISTSGINENDVHEISDTIKAAIAAKPIAYMGGVQNNKNSDFSINDPANTGDPNEELENALAEASLREVLSEMSRTIKKISYNKEKQELEEMHDLAATLYLAGAASFTVHHLHLPQKHVNTTVPLILTRFNTNPEVSASYMHHLNNYIHTPRHAVMFEQGVKDAKARTENDMTSLKYEEALVSWNAAQTAHTSDSNSFFSATMFTDIENFTESTRVNGDQWMIDILHAHNDIVRKVLEQYQGHEIKHTGDGILSMFSNVHKAVDATIVIQRSIQAFSNAMPNRKFKVRVGLAVGEVISIDGDIFGESVNLAARVMGVVDGGGIAIPESTHKLCEGSTRIFTNLGPKELKGFEPQNIYSVLWEEDSMLQTSSPEAEEPATPPQTQQ